MVIWLLIGAGGALGAMMRFSLSNAMHSWLGRGEFPYGSLAVNFVGSLLIGFFYVWLFDRLNMGDEWRAFVVVGLLGGFTTFSAFSIESVNLLQRGQLFTMLVYVGLSVSVCIGAAYLGVIAGKQLA